MGLFDFGSSRKTSTNTSTAVAVDSYNRSFNNVSNMADSNNLTVAVGETESPFNKSGDTVQKTAIQAAGAVLVVAAIVWAYRSKK